MSLISTERDIAASAKIRAEAEREVLHSKSRRHKPGLIAALCAAVLTCGITVSAAGFGWTYKIFGDSAAIIEENPNDYSVKIGNIKVENAEGLGSKFTVGEVISDGKMLYINIIADDPQGELCWGTLAHPGYADSTNKTVVFSGIWETIDIKGSTTSTAAILKLAENIKKGDVIELKLTNGAMKNDFLTPEEAKKWRSYLATVSFEIQSDINTARTITVNKTAVFKDRPVPDPNDEYDYDENKISSAEINIDTLTLSPFCLEINGTADLSQNIGYSGVQSGWGNIWFVYKNGEKKCVTLNTSLTTVRDGYKEIYFYGDFSNSLGGTRTGVQNLNDIEAIEFDGFSVPLNDETEE